MTADKPTASRSVNAGAAKEMTIAAIILAGGSSRRFGAANKLLADVDGVPLIRHVVLRILASRAGHVIVVTGHEGDKIKQALAGLDVIHVHNPKHLDGMSTTVAAGIKALPAEVRATLITPGDLPEISGQLIDRLIAIAVASGSERIVYPTLPTGEQRNPVLWPQRYFADLAALSGDTGARGLIKKYAAQALPVPMETLDAFADIDRPEDLEAWRKKRVGLAIGG
jgi:molybdenum cofactor cytidylyltransferase